ncbi:hypothetical protein CUT44_27965 [Streptomyces carminius]|uniref:RloB domain-containing protein n=1 Tax=Streptomyces carminius TaxID=2665496 RepID=A0A2M8LQB1_9ACTN|nr:RloB family protein [Streptomyces carminius]PJE94138.1 hypothetical protein CUT44_27965 [Streptomyces carminius]
MARIRGRTAFGPVTRPGRGRRRAVYVFTEGKVTEPKYIEIVRKHGTPADPALTVAVHIANAGDDGSRRMPMDLVERAVALRDEKRREDRKAKLPPPLRTQVWCLFDHDNHPNVDAALSRARRNDLPVAFSHPCFEVWRVLHHKPASGTFGGVCDAVTARLPAECRKAPGGIKAVLPEQVVGRYGEARKRALAMNAQHGDHLPLHKRDPYTNVYEFVEKGLGISMY